MKGIFPVQNEFDLVSSSISTATEKNFGSALVNMNTGDMMAFGGNDDDYEYMLNGAFSVNVVSGAFSNLAITFDSLFRRGRILEIYLKTNISTFHFKPLRILNSNKYFK